MLHFFFQEGSLPGLGTFGGGQIIETDEAMTQVLSINPLYPPLLPPPPAPAGEKEGEEERPLSIQESGKRWPDREK